MTNSMVVDPYKTLGLPHSADKEQIKRSYRVIARKYHPDRLVSQGNNVSEEEKEHCSKMFAQAAAAYALLTDPKRKADYDHIYKYGGYDDDEDDCVSTPMTQGNANSSSSTDATSRKRKAVGVGYSCTDPLAFLWTQGKIHTTRTVAGIQIPSRIQMANPNAGLRFAYSSGAFTREAQGTKKYTSRTTQFAHGKKFTRTETTIVHADGRKEMVIEGHDYVERRFSAPPKKYKNDEDVAAQEENQLPWYMNAWIGIRDKLTMCYAPCVAAQ